jgi:predicted nucleic acid-binding Zn ribbon protein
MELESKEVTCTHCGHVYESSLRKSWCEKCCRPVFYYEKEGQRNKMMNFYMISMALLILTFVTYMIIEFVDPFMS